MYKTLKSFFLGCEKLGFIKTIEIFVRLQFGWFNNIKLRGIKHKFSLRAKTSDFATFFSIFIRDEYNINFDSHSQFVIDGGANCAKVFFHTVNSIFPAYKFSIQGENIIIENIR